MIRLSEAMARLYCKDQVQPKHVKEAFRLLNKSIIRVETPDIDFDEDQQQAMENGKDIDILTCGGEVCVWRSVGGRNVCFGGVCGGEMCVWGECVEEKCEEEILGECVEEKCEKMLS